MAIEATRATRPRFGAMLQWMRDWGGRRNSDLAILENATGEEMQIIRAHVRRNAADLRWLAGREPGSAELLCHIIEAVDIDPAAIPAAIMRKLQRGCAICNAKLRCADELAHRRAGERFQAYCPNAEILWALRP